MGSDSRSRRAERGDRDRRGGDHRRDRGNDRRKDDRRNDKEGSRKDTTVNRRDSRGRDRSRKRDRTRDNDREADRGRETDRNRDKDNDRVRESARDRHGRDKDRDKDRDRDRNNKDRDRDRQKKRDGGTKEVLSDAAVNQGLIDSDVAAMKKLVATNVYADSIRSRSNQWNDLAGRLHDSDRSDRDATKRNTNSSEATTTTGGKATSMSWKKDSSNNGKKDATNLSNVFGIESSDEEDEGLVNVRQSKNLGAATRGSTGPHTFTMHAIARKELQKREITPKHEHEHHRPEAGLDGASGILTKTEKKTAPHTKDTTQFPPGRDAHKNEIDSIMNGMIAGNITPDVKPSNVSQITGSQSGQKESLSNTFIQNEHGSLPGRSGGISSSSPAGPMNINLRDGRVDGKTPRSPRLSHHDSQRYDGNEEQRYDAAVGLPSDELPPLSTHCKVLNSLVFCLLCKRKFATIQKCQAHEVWSDMHRGKLSAGDLQKGKLSAVKVQAAA